MQLVVWGEVARRVNLHRFENQLTAKEEAGVTHADGATIAERMSLGDWVTQST